MAQNELQLSDGVLFEHACDILQNHINLGVARMARDDNTGMLDASLLVPYAVNASLACELYIKSMLLAGTKGHNLRELFDKLDSTDQGLIKDKAVEEILKQPGISSYNEDRFEKDFDNMGNGFVTWQYFYEGNTKPACPQFYKGLMITLRVLATEKIKE